MRFPPLEEYGVFVTRERRPKMKKITLVSVAALLLAATVFAPVAQAQQLGNVESVTLGTGGSVTITGTVQCTEGGISFVDVTLLQSRGYKQYNRAFYFEVISCESTGPIFFTSGPLFSEFPSRPFRKGKAVVDARFDVCPPESGCEVERSIEEIRIR
jgi:hypothetical protein